METTIKIEVVTIVLWNFGALLVQVAAFVIIYLKTNKNAVVKSFFVVQASMMIWLIGKIFKTVAPTVELRWFFIVFYYFGICLLGVAFFEFSYRYARQKALPHKLKVSLYAIGLIQFLIVATNPLHHKFYRIYHFWGDDFGPLFYVHVIINYLFILAGMLLCSGRFKSQLADRKPLQRSLITIAILVPLLFNFIYISRLLETIFDYLNIQIFDITCIVYTWSILLFVYATFKYEVFYVNPIMKHEIAKNLENPVLILNLQNQKLYANHQFERQLAPFLPAIIQTAITPSAQNPLKIGSRYYFYSINRHTRYGNTKSILSFTDVTSYQQAKQALDKKNQELASANRQLEHQIQLLKQSSLVGAQNYIARELHDVLGHALVIATKLLEVSKIYYRTDKEQALQSLNNAIFSIQNGLKEMSQIKANHNSAMYNTAALEKEIKSMLKILSISGIEVRFFLRGDSITLGEKIYTTLRRIITELITNTLKHAKATKLLVSITVTEASILIQTMDNGQGSCHFIKGNGLTGIDDRLALVGGHAKYTVEPDNGFLANIQIPRPDH